MVTPAVTYSTFPAGTTADGTQVSQNFTDMISSMTDATKTFSIAALTVSGLITTGTLTCTGVLTAASTTDATSSTAAGTIVSGGLAVAKAAFFGGVLTERIDQNANTQMIISNQTSGTSAVAKLTVKANSASGYFGAFDTANTDVAAFADRVIVDTNSDATGLTLSTGTAGQDLQIRSGARALALTIDSAQVLNFNVSGNEVAPANSQTATLGTVTPVAFGTTTPTKWLKVKLSDGNAYYLPLWK